MKCKQDELQKEKLESKKRREAVGPAVLEDEVKVVEKQLSIREDSNGIIKIEAIERHWGATPTRVQEW